MRRTDSVPASSSSPRTFAQALDANQVARTAYDRLTYSHKREHVRAIESAKKPETRVRRIETAIARLQDQAMPGDTDSPVLSVMLIVPDAVAALGWYRTALGAAELWNLGGVAGLHIDGAPFFIHEAVAGRTTEPSPSEVGLTTTRIEVFVDEPSRFIDRAAEAGATAIEPLTDHETPWGVHRQGGFTDPFGHRWSVGDRTPLEPFPR